MAVKEIKDMGVSVLTRLKKQAKETGINYQTCLQLFAQEEFLRKLEMSGYAENLVLKGGMFLYTISNYEGRPTMDIDFMLRRMSNDVAGMETIMEEICQADTHNDFISMEVLGTRKITPEKKYPGIGINLMAEIKKSHIWEDNPRHALTIPQQKAFMDYLKAHREYQGWVPIITVLLGTGMRIGECISLRWDDLDFEKRIISVNHTFIYRPDENRKSVKHISTPKTISGRRTIPMLDDVFNVFLDEYEIPKCIGFSSEEIDGYSNFVFVIATGTVYLPNAVNRAIERARVAYNKEEIEKAEKEDREPLIIPHFSAHHLRHTFCTRLCENESNLKVIQSIMGHSDITTTMDIYAEETQKKKQEIVANLQGKNAAEKIQTRIFCGQKQKVFIKIKIS